MVVSTGSVDAAVALKAVTRRVVVDYLGLQPMEAFLLVTDAAVPLEIVDGVLAAAAAIGADATHARIPIRATSGEEPPPPVVGAMIAADVCLCIASRSIYHTNAKGRAQASGTRGCFNAPASLSSWTEGAMTADLHQIRQTAEKLADRLRGAARIRVTSPAGTDVTVQIGDREPRGWYTGIVREPGEISAFPGGEVSFPPVEGRSHGTIVFERVMTDIGALAEPVRITVADGLAAQIHGGDGAARLRALIDGIQGATNIGELGIGLNPAARISDDITETKKAVGTAHFALGDSAGGYGGTVECPLHIDGMVMRATVEIDGDCVVRDGKLLL